VLESWSFAGEIKHKEGRKEGRREGKKERLIYIVVTVTVLIYKQWILALICQASKQNKLLVRI